jgi:hypothetical protein
MATRQNGLSPSEISVVDKNGQKYDESISCGGYSGSISGLVAGGGNSTTPMFEVSAGSPLNLTFTPGAYEKDVLQSPFERISALTRRRKDT